MPLAPRPDVMAREVAVHGRGPESGQPKVVRRRATDGSPMQLRILRHGISVHTADLFRWLMDVCELSARDERVWKLQRRMLLDRWAALEKAERAFINSIFVLTPEELAGMVVMGQENSDVQA